MLRDVNLLVTYLYLLQLVASLSSFSIHFDSSLSLSLQECLQNRALLNNLSQGQPLPSPRRQGPKKPHRRNHQQVLHLQADPKSNPKTHRCKRPDLSRPRFPLPARCQVQFPRYVPNLPNLPLPLLKILRYINRTPTLRTTLPD